ncbi:hypothetical protein [Clostridium polynesiense]|uniref:hypothetical protein n=1 Tax=Clostridium polynesiense TaxID=1325933 RepID=UPI00058BF8E3|nr:hypothetical protein [Clostridium polynesiense]
MKRLIILSLIIFSFMLSGCGSISRADSGTDTRVGKTEASSEESFKETSKVFQNQEDLKDADSNKTPNQPLKPVSVKELNQKERLEIHNKLNSLLKSIEDSLQSIEEVKDIDLNTINN